MVAARDSRKDAIDTSVPLLRTVDLTRHFRLGGMLAKKQVLHAVDDLDGCRLCGLHQTRARSHA